MIFLAPWVLLGLAALPALYFLLRLTPPAPRRIAFPPLALLRGLAQEERTAHRMPLWLLLLRLLAADCIILGLAGPTLHPPPILPGAGPVLLVIDNGWAAAATWPQRLDAARQIIAAAKQSGRGVAILATARDPTNAALHIQGVMTAAQAAQTLDALSPQPWPVDRLGAATALKTAFETTRIYLADGSTGDPGFAVFMQALRPDRIIGAPDQPALLLPPSFDAEGNLIAHVNAPAPGLMVLAQTASGAVLARASFGKSGDATIKLPFAISNRVAALRLAGSRSAGAIFRLDGNAHAVLIGLAAGNGAPETPYLGALFFISRALAPGSQIVTGNLATLIADKTSVIILADAPLSLAQQQMARDWMAAGGEIIRFAGPITAAQPDTLQPDPLLAGDRRLGGALTWTKPQNLAPFPASSPLAGLSAGSDTKISRQILADPTRLDPATIWATLADGTPLVLGRSIGKGLLVSVLTTANTDWSNLALAGIYPAMLGRLAALGRAAPLRANLALLLQSGVDAYGGEVPPPPNPATITSASLAQAVVSPITPAGLYGAGGAVVALNLGGHIPAPIAAVLPRAEPLGAQRAPLSFGNLLLAGAIVLLSLDLLISLGLRGLIRRPKRQRAALAMLLLIVFAAPQAQSQAQTLPASIPPAALQTQLAYIQTGDIGTDQMSADALAYLSSLVSDRSSAQLGPPAGVDPDTDPLNLYPLMYWPVLPGAAAPSAAACAALNSYMQHGGLLLIDSQGSDAGAAGSGAGFAPGADAALNRATACLNLPPLEALTTGNAIAHSFYIVPSFPGKFTGSPVLIANAAARDADGVTPIIIGQNDWAAAWAHDATGEPEQTPLPGGEDQRVTAGRFGVNLVIYALTGDYKADQSNLPAFLDRLGQ